MGTYYPMGQDTSEFHQMDGRNGGNQPMSGQSMGPMEVAYGENFPGEILFVDEQGVASGFGRGAHGRNRRRHQHQPGTMIQEQSFHRWELLLDTLGHQMVFHQDIRYRSWTPSLAASSIFDGKDENEKEGARLRRPVQFLLKILTWPPVCLLLFRTPMYPRLGTLLVAGPGEVSLALPAATQLPPATSRFGFL